MVVGLGICPLVRFRQILKSSDEICSGNGVLALGTKEFRNFVLLHSEVEISRPIASSTWCGGNGGNISLGRGVASAVAIGVEVDVAIIEVIILWGQIDIVGSSCSRGHCCCVKALNLLKSPAVFVFLRSFALILRASSVTSLFRLPFSLKVLIDVLFLSAFRCSGSVCVSCVSFSASVSAFLCFVDERRFSVSDVFVPLT